jgi:deoxyribose-phosphate aldolase
MNTSAPTVKNRQIAALLEHTLLHPLVRPEELEDVAGFARHNHLAGVCVLPMHVALTHKLLKGSTVSIVAIVGLPKGNADKEARLKAVRDSIYYGASEVGLVLSSEAALTGQWAAIEQEIKEFSQLCVQLEARSRVLLETRYLDDSHLLHFCALCTQYDIGSVAALTAPDCFCVCDEDLVLLRENLPAEVRIVAFGPVKDIKRLMLLENLGCVRVSTPWAGLILEELNV